MVVTRPETTWPVVVCRVQAQQLVELCGIMCCLNWLAGQRAEQFKGTVARDFLVSVFFMDLLYLGPRFRG
jgi:hypothetical protein